MSDLHLSSTVCQTANPVAAEVAGETVLMSLERSRCYGLGDIGSGIWKRLQSPVRVSDLVASLREEYEAAPGVLEQDVLELLSTLANEGLIDVSSDERQVEG